ncbi:hypothetical protein Hanom_Chr12g01156311 [Helianthus anomalus]
MYVPRRPLGLQRVCFLEEISLKKLFQRSSSRRSGPTSSNLFKTPLSFKTSLDLQTSKPYTHLTSPAVQPSFTLHRHPLQTSSATPSSRHHLSRHRHQQQLSLLHRRKMSS